MVAERGVPGLDAGRRIRLPRKAVPRARLGGCPLGVEPAWPKEEFWRWYAQGDPPRASSALGIAKDKALSAMTEVEKRKLCAYRAAEIQRSMLDAPDPSYDFDGGRSYRIQAFGECLERFPKCDVPLEAVENAAFHLDRQGRLAKPAACLERWVFGPLGQCLWGISTEPAKSGLPAEIPDERVNP